MAHAQATSLAAERPNAFRTLPHNVEAEKALIGAIFVNNKAYERVSEFLRPEHFALAQHGLVFEACARLIERGQVADPVTLKRYFEQDSSLVSIGGAEYLYGLAAAAATVINAGEYGRLVYDLHLKRQLIDLGQEVVNDAFAGEVDDTATAQIERTEQRLYDLAVSGQHEGGFRDFASAVGEAVDMAERAHKRDGGLAGVTTGFMDIDTLLGGLHPSDLLILAGRPAMGKTALATNIAYNAAYAHHRSAGKEGAVVGFFSLEMSSEQLAARILSEQTNIGSDAMRKGMLTTDEFERLVLGSQALNKVPIFIDDTPALSVSALRTRARRLKRQHNLGLIVVDYLQLIGVPNRNRNDGRVQEVSEVTRGLKTLAKELNVPVIALSQLSREVEKREDKRPQLSDLRESGSIEQDADVVAFVFRPEYYISRAKPVPGPEETDESYGFRLTKWEDRLAQVKNLAEVIVAKQRHGPVGTVHLTFQGEYTRFGSVDRHHDEN